MHWYITRKLEKLLKSVNGKKNTITIAKMSSGMAHTK